MSCLKQISFSSTHCIGTWQKRTYEAEISTLELAKEMFAKLN